MLELELLGKVQLKIDGEVPGRPVTTKVIALLSYLVVTKDSHSRQALATLLWGNDEEVKARSSLHVALSTLRKYLPDHVAADKLSVRFRQDVPYRCDVDELTMLMPAISHWLNNGASARNIAPEPLQRAALLVRGEFMADFQVGRSPGFNDWLSIQRASWTRRSISLLEALSNHQINQRHYSDAIQTLERLLMLEPWYESAHRKMMTAYWRRRDYNSALKQYEACRTFLQQELGIPPMPQTDELYERIKEARETPAISLPNSATPFIGRNEDIEAIKTQLLTSQERLITIVGMGGVGKSRLAMSIALELAEAAELSFLDGINFVSLAQVEGYSGPEAIPLAIAAALDINLPGRRSPSAELSEFLQPEERLIVLDNVEQLLEQMDWLPRLLTQCPDITFLVTSREPLNINAEWRYELNGLTYPAVDELENGSNFPAIALLYEIIERQAGGSAQAHDLDCLRRLSELVDGLPLALIMAGSWLDTISCHRLIERLDQSITSLSTRMRDIPARQRSMRAILDENWQRLSREERSLLAALSIFKGSFSEAAVVAITDSDLFVLAMLDDRCLLQREPNEARWSLHPLVLEYAGLKLALERERPEHLKERYINYFISQMSGAGPNLESEQSQATLQLLKPDRENYNAAWQLAVTSRQVDLLRQMVDPWCSFLHKTQYEIEAIRLLQPAIELVEALPENRYRDQLLLTFYGWIGQFSADQSQMSLAILYRERQRQTAQRLGNKTAEARALITLGRMAINQGQNEETRRRATEALTLMEESGDRLGVAQALNILGIYHQASGENTTAIERYRQALAVAKEVGDIPASLQITTHLGFALTDAGRYEEAGKVLQAATEASQNTSWRRAYFLALYHMARLQWFQGDYDEAVATFLLCRQQTHARTDLYRVDRNLARIYAVQGQFELARRLATEALKVHQQLEDNTSIAIDMTNLGMVELAAGNWDKAIDLLTESIALKRSYGRHDEVIFDQCQLIRTYLYLPDLALAKAQLDELKQMDNSKIMGQSVAWASAVEAAYWGATGRFDAARERLHDVITNPIATADTRNYAWQTLDKLAMDEDV